MVQDVVRKGSNLLLKMRLISLRLYRVRIRSCQKGFSFDRFVRRGVVLLVLVLVWLVLQVGLLLVWVRVSCCDVASWLHWVLPQCLGCNTGTGNSAVSQPRVAQVRVRFWNSGPEAVPQPVTAVSRVFAVLSVHCQPKSSCHIIIYILN